MNRVSQGGSYRPRAVRMGLGTRLYKHSQDYRANLSRHFSPALRAARGIMSGVDCLFIPRSLRPFQLRTFATVLLLASCPTIASADEAWVGIIAPAHAVEIATSLSGRLQAVQVEVGDSVEQGQLLASVDASVLAEELNIARAALESARAELHSAQTQSQHNHGRAQRLQRAAQAVSQEERDNASAEAAMAAAAQDAAAAKVAEKNAEIERLQRSLQRAEIRAPFSGIISVRYLEAGTQVAENSRLFSLMAPDELIVRFALPSTAAAKLAVGTPVYVSLNHHSNTLAATVSWIAPAVDVASQLVFAEARLRDRAPQIRAGLEAWVMPRERHMAHVQ